MDNMVPAKKNQTQLKHYHRLISSVRWLNIRSILKINRFPKCQEIIKYCRMCHNSNRNHEIKIILTKNV